MAVAAKAVYQRMGRDVAQKASRRYPDRPAPREIKFVKVTTPDGVKPGETISLTGMIDEAVSVKVPANAPKGTLWEVPYVLVDTGIPEDNGLVIGQPFVPTDPPKEIGEEQQQEQQLTEDLRAAQRLREERPALSPQEWRGLGNTHFKTRPHRAALCYTAGLRGVNSRTTAKIRSLPAAPELTKQQRSQAAALALALEYE